MADVFQFLQDEISASSRNADLFLATVANVNSSGLTLIMDGELEATTKRYKYMTSGYADPAAGDRVVVMKMSGTFVVLGRIGSSPKTTEGKVNRSGDTMTGDLTLSNSKITQIDQDFNLTSRPSSDQIELFAILRDVSSRYFAQFRGFHLTNGESGINLGAIREVSGSVYYNGVTFYIGDDGSPRISLDYSAAWRKALGLGTNGAFPITIAQGGTGNTGVYWTTTVSEVATAGSGFSITYVVYAQWGKLAMVELGIKATEQVTVTTTTPLATIVTEKRPAFGASARAWLSTTRAAVITAAGNLLTNAGTIAADSEFSFLSTYLLP